MNIKKLCAIILTVTMIIGNCVFANAEESNNAGNDFLQETISNLEKGYSEYYDVRDTEITLCSSHEVSGKIENIYLLEIKVVLKADSVKEMDYYQGVAEYCETAIMEMTNMESDVNSLRIDMLSAKQSEIYDELEMYIGKENTLSFYVKETYTVGNEAEKVILFENGMDYVSWMEMLPISHEELRGNGYATIEYEDSQYVLMAENPALQQTKASYTYEVSDAVSYMLMYTSNPTSCTVCGNSDCKSKANTSKYNSNYKNYASSHSDCANYISQALSNGGIPEDNTWKPESNAWIGVTALTNYMVKNAYWTSVSYNILQKGDIMKFKGENTSHVAMITFFDGVTYAYSAHTHDRLNFVQNMTSSLAYYYRVG